MNLLYFSLAFFLSLPTSIQAADNEPKETVLPEPCTIRSSHSGAFFDLNPLHIPDPALSKAKVPRDYSWNTTGWGMGYNFTLNFCGGVVEDLSKMGGVEGVDKALWSNVSAYYTQDGKVFSLGQTSHSPIIRGRKLVLNYTDGSPCPEYGRKARRSDDLRTTEIIGDDDDDEGDDKEGDDDDDDDDDRYKKSPAFSSWRKKTTIISMLCDKDPLNPLLTLSFIASPDECSYFFEARTSAACAGIETAKQTLSPSGVFGVIALIAIMVYVVGGCVYSRVVLQQRGWKQLPNYSLWAGIFGFFRVRTRSHTYGNVADADER